MTERMIIKCPGWVLSGVLYVAPIIHRNESSRMGHNDDLEPTRPITSARQNPRKSTYSANTRPPCNWVHGNTSTHAIFLPLPHPYWKLTQEPAQVLTGSRPQTPAATFAADNVHLAGSPCAFMYRQSSEAPQNGTPAAPGGGIP